MKLTIRDVIETILADCPKKPYEENDERPNLRNFGLDHNNIEEYSIPHTCDTVKTGNPDVECTGVVTSISATVDVIRKAGELGYNLIIVHEPTYWNHEDAMGWLQDDPLYKQKSALLDKYGIVVWRFHDHMHGHRPDLVFSGMSRQLRWEEYDISDQIKTSAHLDRNHHISKLWEIPATPFRDVANLLRSNLGLDIIHYVGNPDTIVRRVAVMFHEYDLEPQQAYIQIMNDLNVDLMLPAESVNFTLQSYMRDAAAFGMNKVALLLGHFNNESLGMKDLADTFLPSLLGEELPITYISAGDIYKYM